MSGHTTNLVGNITYSRTKCFGYDEFHIQNRVCEATPTVYCHDCKLAFCQSCEDEFHFGKRASSHKRTYANPATPGLRPCIFKTHRRQCKDMGTANCEICAFEDNVCVQCIRIHHLGLPDHTDMISQVSTTDLFPLSGILPFTFMISLILNCHSYSIIAPAANQEAFNPTAYMNFPRGEMQHE